MSVCTALTDKYNSSIFFQLDSMLFTALEQCFLFLHNDWFSVLWRFHLLIHLKCTQQLSLMSKTDSVLPGLSVINDDIRWMFYQGKKNWNKTKIKESKEEKKGEGRGGRENLRKEKEGGRKEERRNKEKKKLMSFELILLAMVMIACTEGKRLL